MTATATTAQAATTAASTVRHNPSSSSTVREMQRSSITRDKGAGAKIEENFAVLNSDPEGTDLEFDLKMADGSTLPGWLEFCPETAMLTSDAAQGRGSYEMHLTVTDGDNVSRVVNLTLNVTNTPPEYNGDLEEQEVPYGASMSYSFGDAVFTDPNGDALTYQAFWKVTYTETFIEDGVEHTRTRTALEPLPSWLTFDATTRTFSGTPPQQAIYTVVVRASDPEDAKADGEFLLRARHFPVEYNDTLSDRTAEAGKTVNYTVPATTFTDPNNEALEYSATLSNDPFYLRMVGHLEAIGAYTSVWEEE
jgi:large repetitive protein